MLSRHPLLTTGASSPERHRGGGHGHTWLGSYGRRFDAIGSSGRPPAYPERDAVFRWCRGGRTERRRSRQCLTVCGEDELGEVASGRSSSIPRVGGASRAWRWRWRPRRGLGLPQSTARGGGPGARVSKIGMIETKRGKFVAAVRFIPPPACAGGQQRRRRPRNVASPSGCPAPVRRAGQ
jgi:hypothetical protein